jgi:hypothetical protein
MSQVSVNEVSCVCLESLGPLTLKGRLAFPFIDQGKGLGYMREREKRERGLEEREKQRGREPRAA